MLNNLLDEGNENRIKMVVVDEIHMLTDQNRGFLLEIILSKIKFLLNDKVQIIGMSATLPNISDLSGWLGASLYNTEFRPTDLSVRVCMNKQLYSVVPTILIPKSTTLIPKGTTLIPKGTTYNSTCVYLTMPIDSGKDKRKTIIGANSVSLNGADYFSNETNDIHIHPPNDNDIHIDIDSNHIIDCNNNDDNNNDNNDNNNNNNSDYNTNSNLDIYGVSMDISGHRIVVDAKSVEMEIEESISIIQQLPLPITLPSSLPLPIRSQRHRPCLIPQPSPHNLLYNTSTSSELDNKSIYISESRKGTVTQSLNEINVSDSIPAFNVDNNSHIELQEDIMKKIEKFDPNLFDFEFDRDIMSTENNVLANNLEYVSTPQNNTNSNKDDPEGLFALCLEPLFRGKSVMLFCPSKRRCEICTIEIANAIKNTPFLNNTTKSCKKNNDANVDKNVIISCNEVVDNHCNISANSSNQNIRGQNIVNVGNMKGSISSTSTSSISASIGLPDKTMARSELVDELRLAPVRLCEVTAFPSYLSPSLPSFLTFIPFFIPPFLPFFLLTLIPSFLSPCINTFLLLYFHSLLPSFLTFSLSFFVQSFLSSPFLPSFLFTFPTSSLS